uniref:Uncharacterized protein n=1 Tax=Arundo donax TaxID=35708 RepID=A0A0A9D3C0_ARUDO
MMLRHAGFVARRPKSISQMRLHGLLRSAMLSLPL